MDQTASLPQGPWCFVPMSEYAAPKADGASQIKQHWKSLSRLFGPAPEDNAVARAEAELRLLPEVRLANLVPPLDWAEAAQAFARAHQQVVGRGADLAGSGPAAGSQGSSPVVFLIGQPCCDHAAIAREWARQQGALELVPPHASQILAGDQSWLQSLPAPGSQPWVMPALERCFLRHANGLELVRHFLERALCGELGPGVVACDSWAFAFIQRIWPFADIPTLTLQAFDGQALADCFIKPRSSTDLRWRTRFLSARNGEPLLPDSGSAPAQDQPSAQSLAELRSLAAHCRGNPGLAWHYWRYQLRTEPEPDPAEREDDPDANGGAQQPAAAQPQDNIVWVAHGIDTPAMPADASEDVAFLLHALLLHRGLTMDLLAALLPAPRARIASQLLRLQGMELVTRIGSCWEVAPMAYPIAREFLRNRSYLVDGF